MSSTAPLPLESVSRLPAPTDNVAIATRRLDPGTVLAFPDGLRTLSHTVLEGHRFAVQPIAVGDLLLSWGLPFAKAIAPIAAGDYVCNQSMLDALAVRRVEGAQFPATPNFVDHLTTYQLDPATFHGSPDPRPPLASLKQRWFLGYRRPANRGVGTRNYIVIVGTTSRTASFARRLAARLQPLARVNAGIDGIVAIAHTEGGGNTEPNNTQEILRALGGFLVHPNVAAVLAVDYGVEPITNERLQRFMRENNYPLDAVPHAFLSLRQGLAAGLDEGERIVRNWIKPATSVPRTLEPLSALRVALQCGGSDAFSGVSGNPLAGAMIHELIRYRGCGVLTETDEAMGAESYLLNNVRDLATAQAFMQRIEAFQEKLRWHGLTPESNPSAGNKFRGLYNIALKSLGAVHKKDPRTRLDTVIDYAQPLRDIADPGFTFMNGPGNDLEGIAGQVAAGCNLIIFATGNGSITNFPFVPTLKITTTTRRHQLLIHEMDINAGRYLDGEPMAKLANEAFDQLLEAASGKKTQGERAGHSQVSLWRNWRQTDTSQLEALRAREVPDGVPLRPARSAHAAGRTATERVALILPTSMCSTQVARLAVERLNAKQLGSDQGITRFVTFGHSEGCGFGGETMYRLLERTYHGYVTHPNVAAALLLEHGCEKIPNDVMRRQLDAAKIPLDRYGWVSVQLDGGIEKAIGKIEQWFTTRFTELYPADGWSESEPLTIALMTAAAVSDETAQTLTQVVADTLRNGGSILLAESDPLLANETFRSRLIGENAPRPSLQYGQPVTQPGLHVVASDTDHWVENLTGFGGCGAHLALTIVADHPRQGHPLLPVLQFAEPSSQDKLPEKDIDGFLSGDPFADVGFIGGWITAVARRERTPAANAQGFVDFQLTRGLLGLTT